MPGPNDPNDLSSTLLKNQTRRHFFADCGVGVGGMALGSLLGTSTASASNEPATTRQPDFTPRAKRVIYLFMAGGPSQLDLFEHKPQLNALSGQRIPESFTEGKRFAFMDSSNGFNLLATKRSFAQYGECGAWVSDLLPHTAGIVDRLTFLKTCSADLFNHAPAKLFMNTGTGQFGRPCMGSWVTYGLGSENANLPGFVVLISSGVQPNGGTASFGSGFLPSVYQGVQCRSKGDPVLFVSDPAGMSRQMRRTSLDALRDLNQLQAEALGDPETLTRIAQYELAYRMQASVPEVMDISKESAETLEAYGARPGETSLANNCLLARRLVEEGVRFVHLFDWGWDFHGTGPQEDIRDGLTNKAATFDKPAAALIEDLEQRGLLDETLILCTGEFGRTPFREGRTAGGGILGRDHYPDCYSIWMAGGGVKGGYTHGASDDLGFQVAEGGVHVHDLQATILHQLGFDHTKLTHRFQGRDFRLTDVHGDVVHDLLS
ncbi:DUF1501 domain-containing protein [bacterium]|nr:DUF1501 domain-containing protein [bacterium]